MPGNPSDPIFLVISMSTLIKMMLTNNHATLFKQTKKMSFLTQFNLKILIVLPIYRQNKEYLPQNNI